MRSVTRMAIHEDTCQVSLRFSIPTIIADLLRWYQVAPTELILNAWQMIIGFFYHMINYGEMPRAWIFRYFF